MAIRVRPSPIQDVLKYVNLSLEETTRSQVATAFRMSYWSARYYLERLVNEGKIESRREWTTAGFVRRVLYFSLKILPPIPKLRLIDSTIAIYSVVDSPKGYKRRFQGFYDVDALRDDISGKFDYSQPLTQKEISICLSDIRARFGWSAEGIPAPSTTEPIMIETSAFEFIDKPKGVDLKTLSVIEEEEEIYRSTFTEVIYRVSESDVEEMKRFAMP